MAAYKSVIVLTPNGRRQTVKITPNTTLLQVLEEVCAKHGFNSKEYDLKHHSKRVDLDNVIRFTGLPNNALLEMAVAVKERQDTEVFLGVQIESGERFTGKFMPSESLWSLLFKLCPVEVSKDGNPVIIYMRTEVSGRANLENTTLRSLGITGGRAMLRFMHRSPEELRVQANVSTPLVRSAPKNKDDFTAVGSEETESANICSSVSMTKQTEKTPKKNRIGKEGSISPLDECEELKDRSPLHNEITATVKEPLGACVSEPMDQEIVTCPEKNSQNEESGRQTLQVKETMTEPNVPDKGEPMDVTDSKKSESANEKLPESVPSSEDGPDSEPGEEVFLLPGDHRGCLFSLDESQPVTTNNLAKDLPDEFFEVTLQDARILLRDLKQRRAELEDAPLLTSGLRHQQEMNQVIMPCVLRIMFPDRVVLQGCFVGGNTVEDVKDFVQEHMEKPQCPFHLYISPPKVVLKSESLLYQVDGFPTILVYFAYDKSTSSEESRQLSDVTKKQYLRDDVLSKSTSQTSATKVAQMSRGICSRTGDSHTQWVTCNSTHQSTSKGKVSCEAIDRSRDVHHSGPVTKTPDDKVPKWFRSTK